VMKTKADRMWDEFGANFSAVALRNLSPVPMIQGTSAVDGPVKDVPADVKSRVAAAPPRGKWWQRIVDRSPAGAIPGGAAMLAGDRLPTDIYVELHLSRGVLKILWPASAASEAVRWLKDIR
jgi:hypothetical protein